MECPRHTSAIRNTVPPRGIVEKQGEGEIRAREGSRDVSWIHCDTFHVELFVLRVGVQFSGEYDTRKSGRPSPSPSPARICARASFLFCRFTPLRDRGRPSRWAKERVVERTFLAIRDTLMAEDALQTTVHSNTFFFFPLFLFLFLSLSLSPLRIKGSARVNFPFHSFENY